MTEHPWIAPRAALAPQAHPWLVRGELGAEGPSLANPPNAITLAGYFASVGWLVGGPWWLAIAGLLADELDGRVARAEGTSTPFGSMFDWATDITLTGLVAARLGILWVLPGITAVQAWLRNEEIRPEVGSARAVLTLAALVKGS